MIPERVSPQRFAAAMAERLNAVVPAGLSVRAEGTDVSVYDPRLAGGSASAQLLTEEDGRSTIELVENAAYGILNSIQDVVMESTREQWPAGRPRAAEPGVRIVGERLLRWFGDEDKPVVRLDPINLSELGDAA